ncbi:T9SS type A sorting domain-containing protein [Flexibacter flexilis]|nr:T9SS type A sorting domain-containing protein [Flexibacter flexilis]
MKKIVSLSLLLGLLQWGAFAQMYQWAKNIGGTGAVQSNALYVDAVPNLYTIGVFSGTADFDPSAGVANMTSSGGNDIFITKFDANGNFIWAKSIGGTSTEEAYTITADATGNIYLSGIFTGTVDFDPSAATYNLTALGTDIFVLKLNNSGNFVWAQAMTGLGGGNSFAIAVDNAGNVYNTGYLWGIMDFDPGALVLNLSATLAYDNLFVQKLDASGNLVWAESMSGLGNSYGNAITIDNSGNVLVSGYFTGIVDFDPSLASANLSASSEDALALKLNSAGTLVWVKKLGGTSDERSSSIEVDAAGNVYAAGYFGGTADFDPSAATANLTSAGNTDIFTVKLSAAGNYVWAKRAGASGADAATSVYLDASNNVYTTGFYQATVDFDPSASVANLTSAGSNDAFVQELDNNGNFLWVRGVGGIGSDKANAIAIDGTPNLYITGTFQGTADFDPDASIANLTAVSSSDIFLLKLSNNILPVELTYFGAMVRDKSIALEWEIVSENNADRFEIERSTNGHNFEAIGKVKAVGNSSQPNRYAFWDNEIRQAIGYYYRLKQWDADGKFDYSPTCYVTLRKLAVQVYPNPSGGMITLHLPNPQYYKYTLINHLGQTMREGEFESNNEIKKHTMDLTLLPKGQYILHLTLHNTIINQPILLH